MHQPQMVWTHAKSHFLVQFQCITTQYPFWVLQVGDCMLAQGFVNNSLAATSRSYPCTAPRNMSAQVGIGTCAFCTTCVSTQHKGCLVKANIFFDFFFHCGICIFPKKERERVSRHSSALIPRLASRHFGFKKGPELCYNFATVNSFWVVSL